MKMAIFMDGFKEYLINNNNNNNNKIENLIQLLYSSLSALQFGGHYNKMTITIQIHRGLT